MLTLPPSVRIYVAVEPVDARKSFDGLVALVESEFGLEPLSGHVEINSTELALMLEGIELEGVKRRKRYVPKDE